MKHVGPERVPIIQTGDVICTFSKNILSKVVARVTRERGEPKTLCTHVAIGYYAQMYIEASWKVRKKYIENLADSRTAVLIFRVPGGLSHRTRTKMRLFLGSFVGKDYGFSCLLGHFLDWVFRTWVFRVLTHSPSRPICSSLVAMVYEDTNNMFFGKPHIKITPDDIMDFVVDKGWDLIWVSSKEVLKAAESIYPTLKKNPRSQR